MNVVVLCQAGHSPEAPPLIIRINNETLTATREGNSPVPRSVGEYAVEAALKAQSSLWRQNHSDYHGKRISHKLVRYLWLWVPTMICLMRILRKRWLRYGLWSIDDHKKTGCF
jgi:hypothetical protein